MHASLPVTPATTLEVPLIYLTDEAAVSVQPDPNARAVLFQPDQQRLLDLGRIVLDRVEARGARPGDRLCVFNLTQERLGCETISATDQQLTLHTLPAAWQPDLIITPITSRTIEIAVQQVEPGLTLQAQLYPLDYPALRSIHPHRDQRAVHRHVSAGRAGFRRLSASVGRRA